MKIDSDIVEPLICYSA